MIRIYRLSWKLIRKYVSISTIVQGVSIKQYKEPIIHNI